MLHHLWVHLNHVANVCSILNFRTWKVHIIICKVVSHKRGTKSPACCKCGRSYSRVCCDGSLSCFKFDLYDDFIKECPKNRNINGNDVNRDYSGLVASQNRALSRWATSRANRDKTVFMLSLIPERNKIHQILSVVWSMSSV